MGSRLGDAVEWILCRTVGCASLFSKVAEWPYTKVCNPFVMWRCRRHLDRQRRENG